MEQPRIMVTGGAGFIGSNLSRSLVKDGAWVDCIDNLITSERSAIEDLIDHDRFQFCEFDVTDPRFVWRFGQTKYDSIYQLACPTGVPNIKTFGEEMLDTCSVGLSNVLKLAKFCQAKVVFASSAEVYGEPGVFPQPENYCGQVDPVGPRSAYEEGKRFGEALVALYVRKYGLDAKIIRVFNTYGPGMSARDLRVIPQFVTKILDNQEIVIYGDGQQKRTFLYVDDLVTALKIAMAQGKTGEVYNVGGEEMVSIAELGAVVKEVACSDYGTEFRPHFIQDHSARKPDISKIKKLGWRPDVGITEGISRVLADMEKRTGPCRLQSSAS